MRGLKKSSSRTQDDRAKTRDLAHRRKRPSVIVQGETDDPAQGEPATPAVLTEDRPARPTPGEGPTDQVRPVKEKKTPRSSRGHPPSGSQRKVAGRKGSRPFISRASMRRERMPRRSATAPKRSWTRSTTRRPPPRSGDPLRECMHIICLRPRCSPGSVPPKRHACWRSCRSSAMIRRPDLPPRTHSDRPRTWRLRRVPDQCDSPAAGLPQGFPRYPGRGPRDVLLVESERACLPVRVPTREPAASGRPGERLRSRELLPRPRSAPSADDQPATGPGSQGID